MADPTLYQIAIHGGAGTIPLASMAPGEADVHHQGLREALAAGHHVLAEGGPALEAVTVAVMALEDNPLFNAGHGAVYTAAGVQEMDAAVMDGATRRVGAVTGISGPRNPVQAARAVMEHSPHVLLAGEGALAFLRAHGVPFEDAPYFHTARRWDALQRMLAGRARTDADRHGTVGAVASDRHGHLAAATSTGGMTGKMPGRIGDSPLPGAGTWADEACAVSATGHGESFIRIAAAHELSARLRLAGENLDTACAAVMAALANIGGDGGLIAIDRTGAIAMPFNSQGMYRGMITANGVAQTGIDRAPLRAHAALTPP